MQASQTFSVSNLKNSCHWNLSIDMKSLLDMHEAAKVSSHSVLNGAFLNSYFCRKTSQQGHFYTLCFFQ